MPSRPIGVVLLSVFVGAGSLVALLTCAALLSPGSFWEPMWRLNPPARAVLTRLGALGIVIMAVVATACGNAATGLWAGKRWGYRVAVGLLIVNLLGDLVNLLLRGDWRTLIGLPVGGLLLAYLLSKPIRRYFAQVAARSPLGSALGAPSQRAPGGETTGCPDHAISTA